MLPLFVVALLAQCAFSAPLDSVSISQAYIQETPRLQYPGVLVSSYTTQGTLETTVDGGDTNIYILTLQQAINDLANQPDQDSQALAVAQLVALVGQTMYGLPGSACSAANLIDAYASGSSAAIASQSWQFLNDLLVNLDNIAQVAVQAKAFKYSSSPSSNTCSNQGRIAQFEAAWDVILANASPYTVNLVNEEYCSVRRLYNANDVRSNLAATAVTAASTPRISAIFKYAITPVANFLNEVAAGGSPSAASAKAALVQGYSNTQ